MGNQVGNQVGNQGNNQNGDNQEDEDINEDIEQMKNTKPNNDSKTNNNKNVSNNSKPVNNNVNNNNNNKPNIPTSSNKPNYTPTINNKPNYTPNSNNKPNNTNTNSNNQNGSSNNNSYNNNNKDKDKDKDKVNANNNSNSNVNVKQTNDPKPKTAATHAGGNTKLEDIPDEQEVNLGFAMHKKLTVNDFTFLKVVGKGSFGKVMQVRKNDDGKIYAMKVLKKKALVKRKQVVHTQTERKVLANVDHPFIVSLRYAFQSDAKLYMVLDFFNGGELFFHLKREGRFTEKRSKFYAGEICLALGHLHSKGIIYRDLKPENLLLDSDGHIKITDFGLSKDSLKDGMITHTFCGTPEYLAPEVLKQEGHGKAVDWWSFGTLLYEMMTGLPPFYNQNLNIMYERILNAPIPLPKWLSKEARSIFLGLLERDPKRRLGTSQRDCLEIEEHPFFVSIDFPKLEKKEIPPPFVPKVEDEEDVQNVEDEFTNETPKDSPVMQTGSMLAAKDQFIGFTYNPTQDSALGGK